jgi:succinate-semialdehyde dehydrogenase/glutarate-semialdehyde dehydrogenase
MSSPARKVAGALSAGCSIILKASEETPAGAVQLARAFDDAGLPRGVLNLVFGTPSDISEYLIPQPAVRWSPSPARSRSASRWPRWPAAT